MNPLAATEYVNDIYSYYKRVEHKFRVAPDYMNAQVRGCSVGCIPFARTLQSIICHIKGLVCSTLPRLAESCWFSDLCLRARVLSLTCWLDCLLIS